MKENWCLQRTKILGALLGDLTNCLKQIKKQILFPTGEPIFQLQWLLQGKFCSIMYPTLQLKNN